MIVVRVELWSAVTGQRTELARMLVGNTDEGTPDIGHYTGTTLRGRTAEALDKQVRHRTGAVRDYPRRTLHVWNLVARMLATMGYR